MTFIRAPIIEMEGPDIQILASVDGNKVAARNKTMLVTAFHPELTANLQVLQYFLAKVV
jgi:5'-phosphate synthase pdxT subunit